MKVPTKQSLATKKAYAHQNLKSSSNEYSEDYPVSVCLLWRLEKEVKFIHSNHASHLWGSVNWRS